MLVIRRIHVTYTLQAEPGNEEAINRAHEAHPPRCPVYRTLHGSIDITTELNVVDA